MGFRIEAREEIRVLFNTRYDRRAPCEDQIDHEGTCDHCPSQVEGWVSSALPLQPIHRQFGLFASAGESLQKDAGQVTAGIKNRHYVDTLVIVAIDDAPWAFDELDREAHPGGPRVEQEALEPRDRSS